MEEKKNQFKKSILSGLLLAVYLFAVAKVIMVEFHHASHEHRTNYYCIVHQDYAKEHPFTDQQCSHFETALEDCELCVAHISLFQIIQGDKEFHETKEFIPFKSFYLPEIYSGNSQVIQKSRAPPYLL